MTPLSHLKLQYFSITTADFAESHCCAHASCEQPQLLWWTSWPHFHRIFCPLNKVSLPGGLTHAHALPQLLGIIKVSSASTWRPTSAKLFTHPPSPSRLGVPEQQPSRIKSRIIGRSFACTVWEEVRACLREALHATSSDRGARRHVSRLWHIQEFLPGCPILAYC